MLRVIICIVDFYLRGTLDVRPYPSTTRSGEDVARISLGGLAQDSDFQFWRYSLYKIRTFFETNPDEE